MSGWHRTSDLRDVAPTARVRGNGTNALGLGPVAGHALTSGSGGRIGDLASEEHESGRSMSDEVEEGSVGFDGELGFGRPR